YNRARYYDAATGGWISQDPLGFNAGDSNLYRYVNNAPTIGTDPSGMSGQGSQPPAPKFLTPRVLTPQEIEEWKTNLARLNALGGPVEAIRPLADFISNPTLKALTPYSPGPPRTVIFF